MSTCQISNFPAVSISNQSLVPFDIPWYLPSNNKNNSQNWNSIYSDEGALSIVCFLQMKETQAQSGHPRSHRKYLLGQESTPGSSSSSSVHLRDSWQKLCKCQHSNVSCRSRLIFLVVYPKHFWLFPIVLMAALIEVAHWWGTVSSENILWELSDSLTFLTADLLDSSFYICSFYFCLLILKILHLAFNNART